MLALRLVYADVMGKKRLSKYTVWKWHTVEHRKINGRMIIKGEKRQQQMYVVACQSWMEEKKSRHIYYFYIDVISDKATKNRSVSRCSSNVVLAIPCAIFAKRQTLMYCRTTTGLKRNVCFQTFIWSQTPDAIPVDRWQAKTNGIAFIKFFSVAPSYGIQFKMFEQAAGAARKIQLSFVFITGLNMAYNF